MDADGLDQMEIEVWHQQGALTISMRVLKGNTTERSGVATHQHLGKSWSIQVPSQQSVQGPGCTMPGVRARGT